MRILLDTHALLWAFLDSPRLSSAARAAIASDQNEKLVSAVSAMEVTMKHSRGRLDEAAPFVRKGRMVLDGLDFVPLPITLDHASLAGSLDIPHKDPFDRMLIAQSLIEKVPIVSNERLFESFAVDRIW